MTIESNKEIKSDFKLRTNKLIVYDGKVDSEEFDFVIKNLETKLNLKESKIKLRKKVFNIAVEILQNVYHHADQSCESNVKQPVSFQIEYSEKDGYTIKSKNLISRRKIGILKNKLKAINAMTKEKIVELYRWKLSVDNEFWKKGGAGLGLLDAKRRSGSIFFYNFKPIRGLDVSFFEIEVKIKN